MHWPVELSSASIALIEQILKGELTMVSRERLIATAMACEYVVAEQIPGSFVECGVWRGGNAILAKSIFDRCSLARGCYLFDTFKGMTEPTRVDRRTIGDVAAADVLTSLSGTREFTHADVSKDVVINNFRSPGVSTDGVRFVEGDVCRTLNRTENLPDGISVPRLDTDWYESTKIELSILYPLLLPRGVLMIDDYGYWQGARLAVDEFFCSQPKRPFFHYTDFTCRTCIKQGSAFDEHGFGCK